MEPSSFWIILFSTLLLTSVVYGLGSVLARFSDSLNDSTEILFFGWIVFLGLVSVFWISGLSFLYFKFFILAGAIGLFKNRKHYKSILRLGAYGVLSASVFAIPFLLNSNLIAYSQLGTDQWGYLGVSDWVLRHGFEIPDLASACNPEHAWIHKMFSSRERPLTFSFIASVGSLLGNRVALAYYVIPASLIGSIAFALSKVPWIRHWRLLRFIVPWIVGFQFTWYWHFQYQYWAGTIVALFITLYLLALSKIHLDRKINLTNVSIFIFFSLILFPFYNERFAVLCLGLMIPFLIFNFESLKKSISTISILKFGLVGILLLSFLIFSLNNAMLMPNVKSMKGQIGYLASQFASGFGQADILPWYFTDGTQGYDPLLFLPGDWIFYLILGFAFLSLIICFFGAALRLERERIFALWSLILFSALIYSAPPIGTHLTLSRVIPICLTSLVPLTFYFSNFQNRFHFVSRGILALTFVVFAYNLYVGYFFVNRPANLATKEMQLSIDDPWTCIAYAYSNSGSKNFNWNEKPNCFHSMTHFLPDAEREKIRNVCNVNTK